MVIRNLRQKKIVNTKFIFWFVLVCIGIYFLIRLLTSIVARFNQTSQETMTYTLGASISFSGTIAVDNNFPNYTHSLVDKEGKKIGLKSSSINLNAYRDKKIELVGRVKKYFKVTPVIEVDTIKIPNQGLIITANKYFFVKDLIYLDFSSQPQLSATKSGSDIQIWFNEDPVVRIERFVCSKVLKNHDCDTLVTDYVKNNKDNFQSYRDYTFYKHETGFRTTFDDNQFGYLFKNVSDEMVLDISNMFKIVNKQFAIENKMNLLQSNCQNDFAQLHAVNDGGTLTYHDPYTIILGLEGTDKKNNPATCRITFDIWNSWNVTDVQFN